MTFAPHPFTLRQLQYVAAVAQDLSFRRAAQRCRVAQPSLSAQVAQLEEALGVQIFERTQRKVIVTVAGQQVLERARKLLLASDDLWQAAKVAGNPLEGTLRLGIIPTISPYLLPSVTRKVRSHFPKLTLAWTEEKTEVVAARLSEGALDAAVVALEAEIEDVDRAVLAKDPFVLVTAPSHPLAQKTTPVTAPELRGEDMLLLDDGHCFRTQALEVCSTLRAREGEFRATSLSTLVQMVAGGAGITLLPTLAVPTETKRARLHVRALAGSTAFRTIALVWRKQSPLEAPLKQLAAVLKEAYPL